MTLRLPDDWMWDFWFAQDGDAVHVFYLHAPRSLGDPDRRHEHARIGHAVSTDLRSWDVLPDPLAIGAAGAFDDRTLWTGSVVRDPTGWHLFYTGRSNADDGRVQRIGHAVSRDLLRWERVGDAQVLEADPRWYEAASDEWHEVAWRDPFVLADPAGDGFHALITARSRHGDPATRGVIAHAVSRDLERWEVRPPIPSPAGFGHLEVPQVVAAEGSTFLVFCVTGGLVAPARVAAAGHSGRTGTYVVRTRSLLGPFDVPLDQPLEPFSDLYAGKLVEHGGRWWFLGFVDLVDGRFVGELADPIPFDPTSIYP